MSRSGPERREHPRVNACFSVSYRIIEETEYPSFSQAKNISLGGILLTTNRKLEEGTNIALEIRLPFDPDPIMITGRVLESREISRDLIYDTRINFQSIDEKHKGILKESIDYYIKKG
ncbi:MAG: PilZ domain-containing protein [Candidatus Omnitrophota bacterium]|jgi:c-di-GMP-binding flagellar brake protein YcgR